jgi:hypothetical protein
MCLLERVPAGPVMHVDLVATHVVDLTGTLVPDVERIPSS